MLAIALIVAMGLVDFGSGPTADAQPAVTVDAQPADVDRQLRLRTDAPPAANVPAQPATNADDVCFQHGMPVACDKPSAVHGMAESLQPTDEQKQVAARIHIRDELAYTIGSVLDCERMNATHKQACYHPPAIRDANEMRKCVKERAKGRRYWMCTVEPSVYRVEAEVKRLLAGRARDWCVKTTDPELIKRHISCLRQRLEAKDLPLDKEDKWVEAEVDRRATDRDEANKPENKAAKAAMEEVERQAAKEAQAEIDAEKKGKTATEDKRRPDFDKANKATEHAADKKPTRRRGRVRDGLCSR